MVKNKIDKYLNVAKLSLDSSERAAIENTLERLEIEFSAFVTVDTEDVAPMISPIDTECVLREDVSESQKPICDGYFVVPRSID